MDLNHFKNLKKCNSEFKKITEKLIKNPSQLNSEEINKIKIFKIIDMMYYYLSNNKECNINEIYEGVKRDYDNFLLLHPDNDSDSFESNISSPSSDSSDSSKSESSEDTDSDESEESDLESTDSASVYSDKSDDEEFNKMITLTILYHNKNKNNKEVMIIKK